MAEYNISYYCSARVKTELFLCLFLSEYSKSINNIAVVVLYLI